MRTSFRKSFARDVKRIDDAATRKQIRRCVEQIEAASDLTDVVGIRKLRGSHNFYRIRVREYRLGLALAGSEVELVRCLHRKEIYRYFP